MGWPRNYEEAMASVRGDRAGQTGGHIWMRQLDRYGPALYFADLAGIVGRLEQLLWDDRGDFVLSELNFDRTCDLLVDLGNYSKFIYEWLQVALEQAEKRQLLAPNRSDL